MKIAREVTEWADNTPNHIYVFNDAMTRITAYIPEGTDQVKKFVAPIDIDRRGRKFELMDDEPQQKVVVGSKGDRYYLTLADGQWVCTCPGYQYHGKCKHQDLTDK
jgi:hypothetical protein